MIEWTHLDEQLEGDDPEVEVDPGNGQTRASLPDADRPVLGVWRSPQGYHDEEDGSKGEPHNQDHHVDKPGK